MSHPAGAATGDVFLEVIDPAMLPEGDYTVTFSGDRLAATSYTVSDGDGPRVADVPFSADEATIFDGIRLRFRNDVTRVDYDRTHYADTTQALVDLYAGRIDINERRWQFQGTAVPFDYEVRFSDTPTGRSLGGVTLGSGRDAPVAEEQDTYFTVVNTTTGEEAEFAFDEFGSQPNGRFDGYEFIFVFETVDGERVPAYIIRPSTLPADRVYDDPFPSEGDVFQIRTYKAFTPVDRYTFSTRVSSVDPAAAQAQMGRIRAVPNPYVVSAAWELEPAQTTTGRGTRRVDFTHLPRGAVVRIYTVRGQLVREIQHDGLLEDGTVSWDLRTSEGLDVSYGVYFYHVHAEGVGETAGKLAIIQ